MAPHALVFVLRCRDIIRRQGFVLVGKGEGELGHDCVERVLVGCGAVGLVIVIGNTSSSTKEA